MVPPQTGNFASYHSTGARFLSCFWLSLLSQSPLPQRLNPSSNGQRRVINSNMTGAAAQLMNRCEFPSQTHPQTIQDNLSGGDLLPEPSPSNELCVLLQPLSDWSGVTEAACKTVIKQRLCCSGMRWKEAGAAWY